MRRKQARCLLAFFALLALELVIGLFVHDRFVRPYLGDVLVTVLLCCLARAVFPQKPRLLALWVFLLSAAVEFSQLAGLAQRLGIRGGLLGALLGATFDWIDLLCYFLGCAAFFAAERIAERRSCRTMN